MYLDAIKSFARFKNHNLARVESNEGQDHQEYNWGLVLFPKAGEISFRLFAFGWKEDLQNLGDFADLVVTYLRVIGRKNNIPGYHFRSRVVAERRRLAVDRVRKRV